MLQQLKNFDADRLTLDELVELAAFAKLIRGEYETLTLEVPQWLDDANRSLSRVITVKRADEIEKRIAQARAQRSSLKTAEEKRRELDEEIARLTEKSKSLTV